MGSSGSKRIYLNSLDDLPPDLFRIYVEKSKHSINDQYDSNTSTIHFPCWGRSTVHTDYGLRYIIMDVQHKMLDKELELYCKELIRRPYILVGRTV